MPATSKATYAANLKLRFVGSRYRASDIRDCPHAEFSARRPVAKRNAFFDVKCWGTVAEKAATLGKGDEVIVSGRLTQEKWTTADGSPRSKITLVADKIEAVGVPKASIERATSCTGRR